MSLSKTDIDTRLLRLRNLERLYVEQKDQNTKLRAENKALRQRIKELEGRDKEKELRITELALQLEELRTIVFGKKRQKEANDDNEPGNTESIVRTKDSYMRPLPKGEDITHHVHHPLKHGHSITKTRDKIYYVEDIPKPEKTVTKHTVIQGYCTICGRWVSDHILPTATVVLGDRVKRYSIYLHTMGRLSYSQIRELLLITYNLSISDGEIASILKKQAITERPTYEQLKTSIRSEPSIHIDETGWQVQQGDGIHRYGWTMVGGTSNDAVYTLGQTRGKGNALDLLGDTKAVVVSDGYGAYRTLDQPHQLCCAHIHRKLRDLKDSATLPTTQRTQCLESYTTFASIYTDIKQNGDYTTLQERLTTFCVSQPRDPTKLTQIKTQVAKQLKNYLTCLLYPHVSPDNNAAERSLRHVVLKRKISFGSFSIETAERTAILLSVLMTYRNRGTLREWVVGV